MVKKLNFHKMTTKSILIIVWSITILFILADLILLKPALIALLAHFIILSVPGLLISFIISINKKK